MVLVAVVREPLTILQTVLAGPSQQRYLPTLVKVPWPTQVVEVEVD